MKITETSENWIILLDLFFRNWVEIWMTRYFFFCPIIYMYIIIPYVLLINSLVCFLISALLKNLIFLYLLNHFFFQKWLWDLAVLFLDRYTFHFKKALASESAENPISSIKPCKCLRLGTDSSGSNIIAGLWKSWSCYLPYVTAADARRNINPCIKSLSELCLSLLFSPLLSEVCKPNSSP